MSTALLKRNFPFSLGIWMPIAIWEQIRVESAQQIWFFYRLVRKYYLLISMTFIDAKLVAVIPDRSCSVQLWAMLSTTNRSKHLISAIEFSFLFFQWIRVSSRSSLSETMLFSNSEFLLIHKETSRSRESSVWHELLLRVQTFNNCLSLPFRTAFSLNCQLLFFSQLCSN